MINGWARSFRHPEGDIPETVILNRIWQRRATGSPVLCLKTVMEILPAIAMILEWSVARGNYTSITGNDINRLLTRGARHNQDIFYPNNVWGFGELEVNKVFEQLAMF